MRTTRWMFQFIEIPGARETSVRLTTSPPIIISWTRDMKSMYILLICIVDIVHRL